MAQATWPADKITGGVSLKASGAVTTDTTETAVELGKGRYDLYVSISAIETASGDEFYHILLEGNTRNTTGTYYEIGEIGSFGAATPTGRASADTAANFWRTVENPLDYQVRVRTYTNGSISTGITFSVTAYPVNRKA